MVDDILAHFLTIRSRSAFLLSSPAPFEKFKLVGSGFGGRTSPGGGGLCSHESGTPASRPPNSTVAELKGGSANASQNTIISGHVREQSCARACIQKTSKGDRRELCPSRAADCARDCARSRSSSTKHSLHHSPANACGLTANGVRQSPPISGIPSGLGIACQLLRTPS